MNVSLYYHCCDVSQTIETPTMFSQKTKTTLCWFCEEGFPTPVFDLAVTHPINKFNQVARMIRPTDQTPPWRI